MSFNEKWPDYVHYVPMRTMFPFKSMPLSKSGHVKVDTFINLGNGDQWVSTWLDAVGSVLEPHWMVTHRDSWRITRNERLYISDDEDSNANSTD